MKIFAGSYERFLWGWKVQEKSLHLQFTYPAHLGPVKCIAACGSVVATGGSDDTIKLFDVAAHKDMGSLYQHQGAVTCLDFLKSPSGSSDRPTHLLSGSEDGTICIWDTDSWVHLKTMKSHKSCLNSLSIHNSGKVALSVARDGQMKMWNLLNGRCTFTTKLSSEASLIKFAPQSGETYSVVKDDKLEIFDVEVGKLLHICSHQKRVSCLTQNQDNLIFTGGEDSVIRCWDTRNGQLALTITKAHSSRLRGLALVSSQHGELDCGAATHFVSSASSDGSVKIWDTRTGRTSGEDGDLDPVCETSTKARLTCLVACGSRKGSGISGSKGTGAIKRESGNGAVDCDDAEAASRQPKRHADSKLLELDTSDRNCKKKKSSATVKVEVGAGERRKKSRKKAQKLS